MKNQYKDRQVPHICNGVFVKDRFYLVNVLKIVLLTAI